MKISLQFVVVLLLFICTNTIAQRSFEVQFRDFKYQPDENISLFDPAEINENLIVELYSK